MVRQKSFRTKNRHGNFGGFNLRVWTHRVLLSYKQKSISAIDFLNKTVTVVARVKSSKVPDFASAIHLYVKIGLGIVGMLLLVPMEFH